MTDLDKVEQMDDAQPVLELEQTPVSGEFVETGEAQFDALNSLTRLLLGGALEGSSELARRLAMWEAYLRQENGDVPPPEESGEESDSEQLLRHALIGLVFTGEEKARRGLSLVWGVQKRLAKTAVSTARPLTNNRLLQPLQHRLDRAAERGQQEILRWIERGQAEEPFSRQLATLAYAEIVAEFISQLAENREVQELVQQQGVGLAGEVVDQVRERSFTADTVVERLARALTRRPPRLTPPPADLSELPGGPLVSGTN
jgi:hypothetical protein